MSNRDYGRGTYEAFAIVDGMILIVATGHTPNIQTEAKLERLPWRIWPPHYGLFFEDTSQITSPATRPFAVHLPTPYPYPAEQVVNIVDADGKHQIKIKSLQNVKGVAEERVDAEFAVFQQIGVPDSCLIAPITEPVPAIYYNATRDLGPLTYAEAEAWKAQYCVCS